MITNLTIWLKNSRTALLMHYTQVVDILNQKSGISATEPKIKLRPFQIKSLCSSMHVGDQPFPL